MKIADICTRELVTADKNLTVRQAAMLMRERHVGTLVVIANDAEGFHALGIVTDRDVVVEAVARGLDVAQTPLERLAEGKLAVIAGSAEVGDAIDAMKTRGVRRLLVAGDTGQLFGIVALDDLLDAVAHQMSQLARVARAGMEREASERAPLPTAQPRAVRIPAYSYV